MTDEEVEKRLRKVIEKSRETMHATGDPYRAINHVAYHLEQEFEIEDL